MTTRTKLLTREDQDQDQDQDQVRSLLRRRLRRAMAGQDEIDVSATARAEVAALDLTPALRNRVLLSYLLPIVRLVALELLRAQRVGPVIELGDTLTTREAIERGAERLIARWQSWTEYNGQLHKRLPLMTRADLLAAAGMRRKVADRHTAIADWLEALADRVGNATVGEALSDHDVTALYLHHCGATPRLAEPTAEVRLAAAD